MKTKVNIKDPKNKGAKKRRIGSLDVKTDRVKLSDGREYSHEYLKKQDKNGIGYFETHQNGNLIQKIGKFLKKKK